MRRDFVVRTQREVGRFESVFHAEPLYLRREFHGRAATMPGDSDPLHQRVQLQVAAAGLRAYVLNRGVQPGGLPAYFVSVAVRQRAAKSGEANDVGMARGVGQSRAAIDCDQE